MTKALWAEAAEAIRRELATLNLDWIKEDVEDLDGPHDLTPYMILAEAAIRAFEGKEAEDL